MTQLELLSEGVRRRDVGIAATTADNREWLTDARREAARISANMDRVSAVDIRGWADRLNYHPYSSAAWGAIFSGPQWEHVGWTKTKHADGHHRDVKCWRYRGGVGG